MNFVDVVILITCILIVTTFVGVYTYKKIKKKPTGECASCQNKGISLVDKYNKKYKK